MKDTAQPLIQIEGLTRSLLHRRDRDARLSGIHLSVNKAESMSPCRGRRAAASRLCCRLSVCSILPVLAGTC